MTNQLSSPRAILIVDDDPAVRQALAVLLDHSARTIITCHDPDAASVALDHYHPDGALVDIKFSGPFGFEGLDLIARIRTSTPDATIVAMSGDFSSELQQEALGRGASFFLAKPFGSEEMLRLFGDDSASPGEVVHLPGIADIVGGSMLEIHFQPIVAIAGLQPVAWEALARLTRGDAMRMPTYFFSYARSRNRSFELNCACATAAIRTGAPLTKRGRLFINVDPEILPRGNEFLQLVTRAAKESAVDMSSLVFEITERSEVASGPSLDAVRALRDAGASIAIDDLGTAYTHFSQLDTIRPAFMKVAQELGTGIAADPARETMIRHFLELAHGFGCKLIVEGIETAEDSHALARLNVDLGQGYFYGRPTPLRELN